MSPILGWARQRCLVRGGSGKHFRQLVMGQVSCWVHRCLGLPPRLAVDRVESGGARGGVGYAAAARRVGHVCDHILVIAVRRRRLIGARWRWAHNILQKGNTMLFLLFFRSILVIIYIKSHQNLVGLLCERLHYLATQYYLGADV